MKRGPIYARQRPSFMKGMSWHTILPGMRRSGSLPTGSPMILAGVEERMAVALANFVPHAPPGCRPHRGARDSLPPGLDRLLRGGGRGRADTGGR